MFGLYTILITVKKRKEKNMLNIRGETGSFSVKYGNILGFRDF